MISNRCSISSVTLVHFSSKTTLTHSAYPSYGPSSVFVVPLALPASVVRTPGTVSKKCWTPQRHPPAMYTVSILLTFLLLLVQFASMLCTPYGFLASCKSIHHTNSQKVLPHHCRVIIILLKAISLIKWDRFRIRRHNFHIQKILIETHDPFHQLIPNVLSLISRVHQKIMQKCDCFSIIKRANQPDQLITIPRRNNSCGIVHRTDKFFGIIAGFSVNG